MGMPTRGVSQRCHLQIDPTGGAITAVVEHLHAGGLPLVHGAPQAGCAVAAGFWPLKQPWAAAKHLMQAVTGLIE